MPIVARLNQYGSLLATEFNEVSGANPGVSGVGSFFSSEFSENIGITTSLNANVFPAYNIVYDEFALPLYGPGIGTYMSHYTDKTVVVYNEIDEITPFS